MRSNSAIRSKRSVAEWAHWLGLLALSVAGIAVCLWILNATLPAWDYSRPDLVDVFSHIQMYTWLELRSGLPLLFGISIAAAWYYYFPGSIRFALFALSSFAFSFELFTLESVSDAHFWDAVALLLATALILSSLFVIRARDYWQGTSSMQRTLVFSLFLAAMAQVALVACSTAQYPSDFEWTALPFVALVIWPLFSRTKLGWLLVLMLSVVELIAFVTVDRSPHDSLLVALLPALTIILLLLPPVFRWYFPRKDAPAEVPDG